MFSEHFFLETPLEGCFCNFNLNPFPGNALISYPLVTSENLLLSGIFRAYTMGAVTRNVSKENLDETKYSRMDQIKFAEDSL